MLVTSWHRRDTPSNIYCNCFHSSASWPSVAWCGDDNPSDTPSQEADDRTNTIDAITNFETAKQHLMLKTDQPTDHLKQFYY